MWSPLSSRVSLLALLAFSLTLSSGLGHDFVTLNQIPPAWGVINNNGVEGVELEGGFSDVKDGPAQIDFDGLAQFDFDGATQFNDGLAQFDDGSSESEKGAGPSAPTEDAGGEMIETLFSRNFRNFWMPCPVSPNFTVFSFFCCPPSDKYFTWIPEYFAPSSRNTYFEVNFFLKILLN